jgi:predicted small integral membrane protein
MTMATRLAKIAMAGSLALFTFLVVFGNITDYGANFAFVQHVLSMDTTSPDTAPRWRAITSPMLWHAAYWVIILSEALTCAAYTIGTVSLARNLRGSSAAFNRAKSAVYVASALGFLVWFLGFMVIGGEWFAMWQSNTWNGQEAAFRFYAAVLCVGIFIALDDGNPTS